MGVASNLVAPFLGVKLGSEASAIAARSGPAWDGVSRRGVEERAGDRSRQAGKALGEGQRTHGLGGVPLRCKRRRDGAEGGTGRAVWRSSARLESPAQPAHQHPLLTASAPLLYCTFVIHARLQTRQRSGTDNNPWLNGWFLIAPGSTFVSNRCNVPLPITGLPATWPALTHWQYLPLPRLARPRGTSLCKLTIPFFAF